MTEPINEDSTRRYYIEEIESAIDVRDSNEVWIWYPSFEEPKFVLELTTTQVRQILHAIEEQSEWENQNDE